MPKRTFSRKELSQYNGHGSTPAFIAYKGKVYDVSSSFLWQQGVHQVIHFAGMDLTGELAQAPHGAELIERFPTVGLLLGD